MHFRFRGNNIQVVKSKLDPKNGKAKSVPLGSINRSSLAVSKKLKGNATPEEIKEIETWVKRYRDVDDLKRKVAALTLPEQMSAATEWLALAEREELAEIADDILTATARLRRVLNKRGLL